MRAMLLTRLILVALLTMVATSGCALQDYAFYDHDDHYRGDYVYVPSYEFRYGTSHNDLRYHHPDERRAGRGQHDQRDDRRDDQRQDQQQNRRDVRPDDRQQDRQDERREERRDERRPEPPAKRDDDGNDRRRQRDPDIHVQEP